MALFIRPVLWGAGAYLVMDEVAADAGSHILILDAPQSDEVAATVWKGHQEERILVIEKIPGRPMQLGVLPPFDVYIRDRLSERGVPADVVEVIPGKALDQNSHVKRLGEWLKAHPKAEVVALNDRLSGRSWRKLLDQLLPPEDAKRVHLHGVARPEVDAGNWWRTKVGIFFVLHQYLTLAYSNEEKTS